MISFDERTIFDLTILKFSERYLRRLLTLFVVSVLPLLLVWKPWTLLVPASLLFLGLISRKYLLNPKRKGHANFQTMRRVDQENKIRKMTYPTTDFFKESTHGISKKENIGGIRKCKICGSHFLTSTAVSTILDTQNILVCSKECSELSLRLRLSPPTISLKKFERARTQLRTKRAAFPQIGKSLFRKRKAG